MICPRLKLVIVLFLVEYILCQRFGLPDRGGNILGPTDDSVCPRNFRCVPEDRCPPIARRGLTSICDITIEWETYICCPNIEEPTGRMTTSFWTNGQRRGFTLGNANADSFYPEGRSNSMEGETCPPSYTCVTYDSCTSTTLLRDTVGAPRTCGETSDLDTLICCSMDTVSQGTRKEGKGLNTGSPIQRATSPEKTSSDCGRANFKRQGFVLGGLSAEQGEWPWMVAVDKRDEEGVEAPHCTGFLIDRQHVLTAAHCFDSSGDISVYVARVGNVDLTQGNANSIARILIHPGYEPGTYYDDIALLTLTSPVEYPDYNPICLPDSREFIKLTGRGATVAGWGANTPGGPMTTLLQQLSNIPVIANERCQEVFSQRSSAFTSRFPSGITAGFLCAGFEEGGKDSCGGDSGGPLMYQMGDQWYAVGIVSFGFSCGKPGIPGGYTRVTEYLAWINENRKDV